jgi:hypothetical protein
MELLQNADDTIEPRLNIHVIGSNLIIVNDELGFRRENFIGIIGVADTTKVNKTVYTGPQDSLSGTFVAHALDGTLGDLSVQDPRQRLVSELERNLALPSDYKISASLIGEKGLCKKKRTLFFLRCCCFNIQVFQVSNRWCRIANVESEDNMSRAPYDLKIMDASGAIEQVFEVVAKTGKRGPIVL